MRILDGKVAIVTGASKGIGAGIAKAMGTAGASVVVNYLQDKSGAERVVAEIEEKDSRAIAVQADVSKTEEVKSLFQKTKTQFGRLDTLVNNAGIYSFGPFESVIEEEFHRQFNTNVLGTFLTIQEALKYFDHTGGSIINIGTAGTRKARAGSALYLSTKGATDILTRSLSLELGTRQIRVNSILPGAVETEGAHTIGVMGSAVEKEIIKTTPLGRFGQPADIAPVAVFLASDAGYWVTGELIQVSGGF
jgi:3-oxoacyl-[acyl-carrier protein] reductase